MTQENMLERAIRIASGFHSGQRDKAGLPYILHPLAVMLMLPSDDWDGRTVAVLHDVVEDTACTVELLAQMGFPAQVIEAIDAISRRQGETNRLYWIRCKANPIARRVKIKDMEHNSSVERIRVLPYDQQEYLTRKYEEARVFFAEEDL
jgi:(p)ppGpp synthase/HD superfamily hydrolase